MAIAIGAAAPEFQLRNQHGQTIVLGELLSRRSALIVFIPLAFSAICTDEVAQLNQWHDIAASAGVEILVISVDAMATLRAWADSQKIQLSLLSDFWPHGGVAEEFGVFLSKEGFASRVSFLVDQSGIVRDVIESPLGEARQFADYERAIVALTSDR
ncbi:redoxin domain-containing protein [Salinibacterium sp. M195]|uniref:redoxin domain-containing protein n=1 Tax=Salinibacterium sp. M195 TaxID=2583374 RepID=UPI001C625E4C|nr:redoxin domain-containing protein [Salinibacterium sp. M195]QYH36037.1 redoxin domain-containing protein [Salinibacterium sp. M195]